MSRYTKEDIFRIVEEEDVEFIRLQFTDIFGTLKNIAITSSQLEKALDNKCMFDGSSVEGFVRIDQCNRHDRAFCFYCDLEAAAFKLQQLVSLSAPRSFRKQNDVFAFFYGIGRLIDNLH